MVFLIAALTPWLFGSQAVWFWKWRSLPAILGVISSAAAARCQTRAVVMVQRRLVLGVVLGLIAYTYSIGRLLALLLALGLAFFFTRQSWRKVLLTWVVFGLTLLPLGVFTLRHPGALSERFKFVTFVKPGDTRSQIALRFVQKLCRKLQSAKMAGLWRP